MSSMTAAELRAKALLGHWPELVFVDGDGDLCRCSCGEQGFDFAHGREWFAGHLSALLPESGVFVTEEELAGALNNPVMRRFVTGSRETRTLLAAAILRELTR